ncbi:cysteine peptidase family C39 domain-containing protein [Nostoc sp.]|uniref:cysteine peptidase family C39 domain-containing protein n=1 Tax=Nostoc sp. TaxID=1180 RepID=UPI002FF5CA54
MLAQHCEENRGYACFASIAKHWRRNFTLNRIGEAVSIRQLETTLLGLKQVAEVLGFNLPSVRASNEILDQMNQARLPATIHWRGTH